MKKNFSRHTALQPLALAAACVLAGWAPAAQAQFYSFSGAVGASAADLGQVNLNQALLDLASSRLFVGSGAVGSFSALAGAQMTVGQLVAGTGGSGNGSISVLNGALVQVSGSGRLDIGSWGTGSLTVSGGSVVDASVNLAGCAVPGVFCGNRIGNGAGSSASLTITGSGSELRALGHFGIASASVFTQALGGNDFGTAGASTTAVVNVLAGGTLRTANATVSMGSGGPAATGAERTAASVLIDGPGSLWVVGRNALDGSAALLGIGGSASATGTVTVSGGGTLRIDATGSTGPFDGINVGSSGTGTLVATGAGSSVSTSGLNGFINVGANNANGNGSFQIRAGASASSLYMNVGRNSGRGALVVDGPGSQLTLSGVGTFIANTTANGGAAFLHIGRDGGNGEATVSNGGRILITDAGQDGRAANASPGLIVGRGVGSTGALTITGAGSVVEVVGSTLGLAEGTADNLNPFVGIGYDNADSSSGSLSISAGGKLILTGNALSTPTNARATLVSIGGHAGGAGTGTATVTGLGSELRLAGADTLVYVGRNAGATGTLNLLDQAQLSSISLVIGASGSGTVNLNNALIALSGHRTDNTNVGAGMTVGRGVGGVGTLAMSNGAQLTLEPTLLTGGIGVGGDQFQAGGNGTITMSGGSSITYLGSVAGSRFHVGRSGTGTVQLSGASSIDLGALNQAIVGREPGGLGMLDLTGGSWLRAEEIAIGGFSDTGAGGTGIVTLSGADSSLQAVGASGFISVGRGGNGTLEVRNQATVSGIVMNVGRAGGGVGALVLDNANLNLSGRQTSGNQVGAALSVGNRGGLGTATIANNSRVTISNGDAAGIGLNVGGTPINPQGTGLLTLSGGSTIQLLAAPGLARARIGHDGEGTMLISGASRLDVGDGQVIIAGQPGSVGRLTLTAGSTLDAGYVGVGSLPGGIDGGSAKLFVDGSTVNATTLEIGVNGLLGGDQGVINGNVINRGTVSPGNSPGRIIINGSFRNSPTGRVLLDVQDTGGGNFAVDKLVLTENTTFDFRSTQVTFNFLGATDPAAFAASGGLDLDNFIQVQDAQGQTSGLSTQLAAQGSSWEQAFAGSSFSARTASVEVTPLTIRLDQSGTFSLPAVPEPQTWALWLAGLAGLGLLRRQAARRG